MTEMHMHAVSFRHRLSRVLLGLVTGLCAGLSATFAEAGEFCTDLNSVIESSTDLEQIMGPSVRDGNWRAEKPIEGFDKCRVQLFQGRLVYACYERLADADAFSDVEPEFDKRAGQVRDCKVDWNHRVQAASGMKLAGFQPPGVPLLISLLLNRNTDYVSVNGERVADEYWQIMLLVARNGQ